jgi:hypothetical protein
MLKIWPTQKAIDFHQKEVSKVFEETIKKCYILRNRKQKNLPKVFILFLNQFKNELISGNPKRLFEIQLEFEKKRFSVHQLKLIKSFFIQTGYNNFDNKEFLEKLNVDTCVYCNRNYTTQLVKDRARAELDHWFPKESFPILALSFYNLIPSCHSCNHIKHNNHPNEGWAKALSNITHPYIDNKDETFLFSYFYSSLTQPKVTLKTENDKVEKTIIFSKIDKIYESHSNRELKDLLDLRYKYSKNYLDILLNNTFKEMTLSQEEVYRMIFGIEINEQDYHKRPFSKFKKDIIEELLSIKLNN